MKEKRNYILTMLVSNKPSVTSRVTGLFSGRGYNMQSICGAPTHDPDISRITIKTKVDPDTLVEIKAQLNRLIDVVKLRDMTHEERAVKREMALISVEASPDRQKELIERATALGAKVLNEGTDSIIFEITGTEQEVDRLIENLRSFGVRKVTRSGILALYRELE